MVHGALKPNKLGEELDPVVLVNVGLNTRYPLLEVAARNLVDSVQILNTLVEKVFESWHRHALLLSGAGYFKEALVCFSDHFQRLFQAFRNSFFSLIPH